jgi:uncharacterized protein with PIN domain
MAIEELEREHVGVIVLPEAAPNEETEGLEIDDEGGFPPIYGRCPVCNKPLFPRDRFTGEMKAPPVGTGYESRAKCSGCGAIICYAGNGKWRLLTNEDLTHEDIEADSKL